MKNEVILKKDERSISFDVDRVTRDLERMQSEVDWFNGLHYTQDLTTIDEARSYRHERSIAIC